MTWWCLIVAIRPRTATKRRKTPHATIPPTMGKVTTILDVLAYVATPMSKKATICRQKGTRQILKIEIWIKPIFIKILMDQISVKPK